MGLGMATQAHGQFIGYTSPQTVQQTVALNVACTGAPQLFSVQNLGQTQHQATAQVSATTTTFTMQFLGVDNQSKTFPISEIATVQNNSPITNGVLQAVGYFPLVQIQVVCVGAGATFTVNYSGSSSVPIFERSGYQVSAFDKYVFQGRSQTTNSSATAISSPTFNTAGEIIFNYVGAPSGALGSINVTCQSQSDSSLFSVTFATQNVTGPQIFPVAPALCPFPAVTYVAPGTPNGSFLLEYIFNPLGSSTNVGGTYSHVTGTTATAVKPLSGFLHTLTINTGAAGTVSIFDLTAAGCTGTPVTNTVAVITAATTTLQTFTYDTNLLQGICVKASVAMDFTVSFN